MTQLQKYARRCWLAFLATVASTASAQTTTLYTDSFSGGATLLNTTLVQGGTLQTGTVAWSANSAFRANGTIDGANEGSAIVPLTLDVNATYTLSMDVQNTTDRWIGLGFKNSALTTPGANFTNDRFSNGGGIAWMLYRDHLTDPTQDIQLFGGPNVTAPIVDNNATFDNSAVHSLKIVLNTTGAGTNFTADFFLDGASISSGPQTVNQALTAIQYVGLTFDNATANTAITFDNFLLTKTVTGPVVNQWNINGGGSFGTAGNWTLGAPTSGGTVQFGSILTAANSPATVTLDAPATLGEVQFSNAAASYKLAGPSTLTLNGAHTVNGAAGTHEIAAVIAGTAGLVKTGGGTVYLSADNTYTGTTDIQAGSLRLRKAGAVDGTVSVAAGATVGFSGDALASGLGFTGAFTPDISGAGGVLLEGLTTETVSFAAAKTYTGVTTINGGTLALSAAGSLGTSDGTAATQTVVAGNATTGKLALNGMTVNNELLVLGARELAGLNAVHLDNTGNSTWSGNIKGDVGGTNYNINSNSGTLVLSGTISAPDTGPRNFVFDGAGNVNVTGKITDLATDANGAPSPGPINLASTVNVVKRGSGTLTISTATNNNDDYWLGTTSVDAGTLEIISNGANDGEIKGTSIAVKAGATLDVDHFGVYTLQAGQQLSGGGTILATGKTVAIYDDNAITPGDNGVGTLKITGNATFNGVSPLVPAALNFELGNTTTPGGAESDLIQVSGTLTTFGTPAFAVNVRAVEGTLAAGNYRLVSHTGGANDTSGMTVAVTDNLGAALNPRQTFAVSGATAGQVNLAVTGSSAALTWNGTVGNQTWDVNTSSNWTGGPQFRDLDQVTFGSGGVKNVTVNSRVTPGSTTFNGGVGTTYAVSGVGGITGYGPVAVNSGTVQLFNTGNNYAGTTTVASGARLEAAGMTSGATTVSGTLAVKNNLAVNFTENFSGNLSAYSNTRILDNNGGASNVYQWEIAGGALQINTTTYDGIEQTALTRTDQTLDVGEEMRANYLTGTTGTQDIGLYVGAGAPTADVRQNYVAMYVRNNGQVFTRGFNGTTEFALAGGGTPAALSSIFIKRTGADTFETGYYENGTRTILATRTIDNGNAAGIGNAVGFYSDVRGAGIRGSLDDATISTGSASNVYRVTGDLAVAATGKLEFDISSLGYTSLQTTGATSFTAGATVAVNLLGGFMPVDGASYSLLTATGGITGSGLSYSLPALTAGLAWDTSLFATTGVLSVHAAAGLAGDFNADSKVDGADFLAWQRGYPGNQPTQLLSDWKANYGASSPAVSAVGAVPEPAACVLAGLGAVAALIGKRRRSA